MFTFVSYGNTKTVQPDVLALNFSGHTTISHFNIQYNFVSYGIQHSLSYLTVLMSLMLIHYIRWFYYYSLLANEDICLVLEIQTYYPYSLSVLLYK